MKTEKEVRERIKKINDIFDNPDFSELLPIPKRRQLSITEDALKWVLGEMEI